jgi:hypothetical protein
MTDELNEDELTAAEERNLALVERLGLDCPDVMVLDGSRSVLGVSGDGFCIVLIDGAERVIVARHGWGTSGAHVDVSTYVGHDTPRRVQPTVIALDDEVTIYAQNPDN